MAWLFNFKNMSQYIRNVVDPLIKASHYFHTAKIEDVNNRLNKKLDDELSSFRNWLNSEFSEYKDFVNEKLDIQQKTIEAFPVIQVGTIVIWPFARNPSDISCYLECNGQAINSSMYPELYALVGPRVPDLRGLFLRGYGSQVHTKNNGSAVGDTATTHASAGLLTVQGDTIRNFTGTHKATVQSDGGWSSGAVTNYNIGSGDEGGRSNEYKLYTLDPSRLTPTSNEIRPVNMAVRYLMRAKP